VVAEDEVVALRKAGKQVFNVDARGAAACIAADGDHIATIGDNAKVLIFRLDELPNLSKGKGVKLQSYREGGLRDLKVFEAADGLSWTDAAGRLRAWPEWEAWKGRRAGAGRLVPRGFPSSRRFRP
jgi:topoisomerase-4 subunit A